MKPSSERLPVDFKIRRMALPRTPIERHTCDELQPSKNPSARNCSVQTG